MQRKKTLILGLAIVLFVGVVSAAVVNYLSNTIVMRANVSSPITLKWLDTEDPNYVETDMNGGDARFYCVEVTNDADLPIAVVVQIHIQILHEGNWYNFDGEGFYLALSPDISYAWVPEYNPDGLGWRAWLSAHPDWMDWVLAPSEDEYLTKYNTAYISPLTGDRDGVLGYNFDSVDPDGDRDLRTATNFDSGKWTLTMTIEPGTFYCVFWVIADPALQPASYRFSTTIIPP